MDMASVPLLPEGSDPCGFENTVGSYFWLSVREDVETLRDPQCPREGPIEVELIRSKRYRAIRAEVIVEGHSLPFPWILVYVPLYSRSHEYRWLGLHEKMFNKVGATFHVVEGTSDL